MSKEKRHAQLSWKLIEAKIMYYRPPLELADYIEEHIPTDQEYDNMEREYLQLCLDLDRENTIVHKEYAGFENVRGTGMMEINTNRPSVECALQALYHRANIPKELRRSLYTGGVKKKRKRRKKNDNKTTTS